MLDRAVDMAVKEIKNLRFALEISTGAHDVANDGYFKLLKENGELRKTIEKLKGGVSNK